MAADRPRAETSPEVDALVQLSFVVMDVLTRAAAEHDLSATQVRLLGILRDRSPSMAAIAERLRLDKSSVSGLIDRAEARGLVARRASTEDARVTIVDITDAGLAVGEQLAATLDDRIALLLEGIPAAERARLIRVAESISSF
jgi:MarR family transcriptional regulator, lower aerobic nicotinate degradation pathway regulator